MVRISEEEYGQFGTRFLMEEYHLFVLFSTFVFSGVSKGCHHKETRAGSEEPITPVLTAIAVLTQMN